MLTQKYTLFGLLASTAAVGAFGMFIACSDPSVAGNSAEIGNPEFASISGTLTFKDGTPAARTAVRLVPEDFNVFTDSIAPRFTAYTDSNGFYTIDSLPENFSIEANNDSARVLLLRQGLSAKDSVYSDKLLPPGSICTSVEGYADGDTIRVSIPGTTYLKKFVVQNNSITIDSLPTTLLTTLVMERDTLIFETPLKIEPDSIISILNTESVLDSLKDTLSLDTLTHPVNITLQYEFTGMDITARQINIPLALRLEKGDVDFNVIESLQGSWQVKRNDIPLKLDKSYFDAQNERAVFWVLMDTLCANKKDTLTLTFTEGDTLTNTGVFDKNFISVYHFDEGIDVALDAANALNGTPYNVTDTIGAIGNAYYYNGKSSYVEIENSSDGALDFNFSDTMSISVWTNIEAANTSRFVFGKGATQFHLKYFAAANGWLFERYQVKTDTLEQDTCDSCSFHNSYRHWYRADSSVTENEWVMLSIVQFDTTFDLYLNGVLADDTSDIGIFNNSVYTDNNFVIGRQNVGLDSTGQYFKGMIDELFIQRITTDSARVKTMYENQRPKNYWPRLVQKTSSE